MLNYDGRVFRAVSNSENGETSNETVFKYRQTGHVLTASYAGGRIQTGHLLGVVDSEGLIELRYHQVSDRGELMTGRCTSTPELLSDGRVRLHENWQWTSGDQSSGRSVIEEVTD